MRVLLLGSDYGTYPTYLFQCKKAFERLGYETSCFSFRFLNLHKTAITNKILNKIIVKKVLDYMPDLLFVSKGANILPGTIKTIARSGIKTVNWDIDGPLGYPYPANKINNIDEYDYFFVFDPYYLEKLKELNPHSYYLPCAADPENVHKEIIPMNNRTYVHDISFIGSHDKKREELLSKVTKYTLNISGYRWNNIKNEELKKDVSRSIFTGERMCKVFNESKINLNIHALHSFESVNLRTFEIPATKSFMLCDYFREIPNLFKMNKEIVCYTSVPELLEKTEYYIDNEEERNKIAIAGNKRVLKEHTIFHRIQTIVSKVR